MSTPEVDGYYAGFVAPEPVRVVEFDVLRNKSKAFYRREAQPLEVEPEVKPSRWLPGGNQKPANLPTKYQGRAVGVGLLGGIISAIESLKNMADTAASTDRARRAKIAGCDCCTVVFDIVNATVKDLDKKTERRTMTSRDSQARYFRNVSHRRPR